MGAIETTIQPKSELSVSNFSDDALLIHFAGDWILANAFPSVSEVERQIESEAKIGVNF